jgi:virginiamycin B lyase
MMSRTRTLMGATLFLLVGPTGPVLAQNLQLSEWKVPWENSRPRDPYVSPDGNVWFVGQQSHYVAYLNPSSGEFKQFPLEDGTGPHNLVVDTDGTVWYTGNLASHIGKVDPQTGAIQKYMMPDERARDPHTLVFDRDGRHMWFTVQGGNFVGRFDKRTGDAQLIEAPTAPGRGGRPTSSRPYGIKMDSQNRPWVALFNTNLIAMVNAATMTLETYELPEGARPRRLVISSDDKIWYVDYSRGYLGKLDPASGAVSEWATPGGSKSQPYGMAIDKDDRIWFVETGLSPNQFVGFDPETQEFFSRSPIESGGGAVRHMYYDEANNCIWFGTDTNTIGRAVLPPKQRRVS